ncbi:MAG TPA: 1-acyl-sn-glycerol-3-phosphate acyltransferase, partial [Streptosporangiaceae bacterium]|nr:1-acyl-sn-glycerol-3-phosphate acyltransferase [Streptosporangiaceae bacterium]
LEARVPVIPCAMVGTFEFQPPGKVLPRLSIRPGVRFGEPLDFSRYYGLASDRLVLRAVTDEIMYALMELSGQEYVDMYAEKAKRNGPRLRIHRQASDGARQASDGARQASGGPRQAGDGQARSHGGLSPADEAQRQAEQTEAS